MQDAEGFSTCGCKSAGRRAVGGKQSGSGEVDPCYMREGYLCEQGERSSLGYEAADGEC